MTTFQQKLGSAGNGSDKIAIINVRVFDGQQLREPGTVIIDAGKLVLTSDVGEDVARTVDGRGGTLLPGLIDAHVHLHGEKNLEQLCNFGVTTALDMGIWPKSLVDSLRGRAGLTDIRSCGIPATAPGSHHSKIPGIPEAAFVTSPAQATQFVADRISEGSDYIKIIADIPGGPDQATINALVTAAHEHGKLTIAHAVTDAAVNMAQEAKVDIITHAPLNQALDTAAVMRMVKEKRILIPTLTMMEAITKSGRIPGVDYNQTRATVTAMYHAGVPILAGTDSNAAGPSVPASVPHGESIHQELELLVDAGLSTVDALRAATSLPANYFGLTDRGVIETGRRADLILIAGDPVKDIRATRMIERVWCAGVEIVPTSSVSEGFFYVLSILMMIPFTQRIVLFTLTNVRFAFALSGNNYIISE